MVGGYEWIVGRKAIQDFLHIGAWSSVSFLENHGLPIRRLPSRRPVLLPFEAGAWLVKFDEANRKRKEKESGGKKRKLGKPFGS